ncbi:MAG: class I SAM-dependent rRNA methyltransferase [Bacteriovoracaceae bacterium]|jgi:23S rRNA (cytosine1962-C5)-methyltransferase|nr:class I SAM-dependent rRNA methyltransferase [Bacteriovoracaceae bacterium]
MKLQKNSKSRKTQTASDSKPKKAPKIRADKALLHPQSIKEVRRGHPWIIRDSYTAKFSKISPFIIGTDKKEEELALLIHDPTHPKIKARVWTFRKPFTDQVGLFNGTLRDRIYAAFEKRAVEKYLDNRQNVFLAFGEADFLPGLKILLLKDIMVFQYESFFWEKYREKLVSFSRKAFEKFYPQIKLKAIIREKRESSKSVHRKFISPKSFRPVKKIVIEEFDVAYEVFFDDLYDLGIYTDMSSIRQRLQGLFEKSRSVLNLYAYTGAFSLFALRCGAREVVSVDLSPEYLKKLDRNLKLNKELDPSKHLSVEQDVTKSLDKFCNDKKEFDLIVCDPPTVSSDKKKMTSALQKYTSLLPKMAKTLSPDGKMVVILNTHSIKKKKFEEHIKKIISENKVCKGLVLEKTLGLGGDCPALKIFPEGDYLKVIVLKKEK